MADFDPAAYKRYNLDLSHLSDEEATAHFQNHGIRERRIFSTTEDVAMFLSMKWLRGHGLEIGAGRRSLPLFGECNRLFADLPGGDYFGQDDVDIVYSLNDEPADELRDRFDFVVCSHVIEHVDSIIRSLSYLKMIVASRGIIYIIVPDREYLEDHAWMPIYDVQHHLEEETNPFHHADHHDRLALASTRQQREKILKSGFGLQLEAKDILNIIDSESIEEHRFVFHKHTYDFDGWIRLFTWMTDHIGGLNICDARYGYDRMDCHFVFERTA